MKSLAINDKLAVTKTDKGFQLEFLETGHLKIIPVNENEALCLSRFLASSEQKGIDHACDPFVFWR